MWILVTPTGHVDFADEDAAALSARRTGEHQVIWDDTAEGTTFFATAVRNGDTGRKWFRCDSSAGGDRRFCLSLAWATKRDNPGLPVALVDADTCRSYRPRGLTMAHDLIYRHDGVNRERAEPYANGPDSRYI